jgi:hypothetical protein
MEHDGPGTDFRDEGFDRVSANQWLRRAGGCGGGSIMLCEGPALGERNCTPDGDAAEADLENGQGSEGSDARPGSNRPYLDASGFNDLFYDAASNHDQICIGLRLIARGVSRHFNFPVEEDREDAASDALIAAIHEIPSLDPSRRKAFSYFSTVMFRYLYRRTRRDRTRWARERCMTNLSRGESRIIETRTK